MYLQIVFGFLQFCAFLVLLAIIYRFCVLDYIVFQ